MKVERHEVSPTMTVVTIQCGHVKECYPGEIAAVTSAMDKILAALEAQHASGT